ncbi:MAG: pimeloyl-ACP methyl ester carboxylesterase [Myxococcota bacterium]|jgi:pimeloyl-ACP methyl ester carboxylesterase
MLPLLLTLSGFPSAHAGAVSLKAADGTTLSADVEVVSGSSRGVVLVHMDGRDRADWSYISERISRSGLSTINLDLRGHGASGGSADPTAMLQDVQAAIGWLRTKGATEVSCVGAELGANLCAQAAAADTELYGLAMLSPRIDHKGVKALGAVKTYGARPSLVVASTDDAEGVRCAGIIVERIAPDSSAFIQLSDAGIGTRMLARDPGLENRLVEWLMGSAALSSSDLSTIRPDTTTETTIETTGEMLPGTR